MMKKEILKVFAVIVLALVAIASNGQAYEQIIYKELLRNNVDSSMAKTIVAIAKHESANFKSKLFTQNKNPFGMTYPPKRDHTAIGYGVFSDNGNKRKFCKFTSTTSATKDFVLYLKHKGYPLDIATPEEMVKLMKSKGYFEANATVYLRAIKKHLGDLKL